MTGSELTLGRDESNDIVLADPKISRLHACLECSDQGCVLMDTGSANGTLRSGRSSCDSGQPGVLMDTGSANGTFVEGQRIERLTLRSGNLIKLGNSILRFEQEPLARLQKYKPVTHNRLSQGRSHFPMRGALVSKDIDELKQQLRAIRQGEQPEHYLHHDGVALPSQFSPALKQFGNHLLKEITTGNDLTPEDYREKLLALADLFVQGYELAWPDLYAGEACQRVSLPTYPFEKKRYWIPQKDRNEDMKTDPAPRQPHPNQTAIQPTPNNEATPASAAIGPQPLRKMLQADLVQMMAGLLKIEVEEFFDDEILDEYGFDSITFIALTNRLNETYSLELMPTLFFEYNTLGSLCTYLLQSHGNVLEHHYQSSAHSGMGPASSPIGSDPWLPLESLTSDHQQTIDQINAGLAVGQAAINTATDSTPKAPAEAAVEAIAIIGMSGVLPGSPDLDHFWQHLVDGHDLITEVPSDRWDWRAFYGDPQTQINKTNVKWGGFMPDVDKFDAAFFRISPREADLALRYAPGTLVRRRQTDWASRTKVFEQHALVRF